MSQLKRITPPPGNPETTEIRVRLCSKRKQISHTLPSMFRNLWRSWSDRHRLSDRPARRVSKHLHFGWFGGVQVYSRESKL